MQDDDPTWSPLFYIYNGPSRSTLCSSSSSFVFQLIGEVGPWPKMLKSNQPSMHACGRRALMHMHAVARLDFPSCFAFASKELITYKWCRLGRPISVSDPSKQHRNQIRGQDGRIRKHLLAVFRSKFWSAKIHCSISFVFDNNCPTIN
jgi:hypothetical protein